jgi:PTS system mannose-specific IIA component
MISIIITTHGNLGKGIIESSKLLIGEQKKLEYCGLNFGDDIDQLGEKLKNLIIKNDDGDGVLILCDIFGGSPCTTCIKLIKKLSERKIYCIAGINLPMLLQALTMRMNDEAKIESIYKESLENGLAGILAINEMFEAI